MLHERVAQHEPSSIIIICTVAPRSTQSALFTPTTDQNKLIQDSDHCHLWKCFFFSIHQFLGYLSAVIIVNAHPPHLKQPPTLKYAHCIVTLIGCLSSTVQKNVCDATRLFPHSSAERWKFPSHETHRAKHASSRKDIYQSSFLETLRGTFRSKSHVLQLLAYLTSSLSRLRTTGRAKSCFPRNNGHERPRKHLQIISITSVSKSPISKRCFIFTFLFKVTGTKTLRPASAWNA